jgi:hypothetical protein
MTQFQQDGSGPGQRRDVLRVKRPISDRKLRANRANAKRSTGPRTDAGKAASRRNALKHGILSLSVDLSALTPNFDLSSLKEGGSCISETLLTDPGVQDINRIWQKIARVLAFERDCMQRPDGLEQNGRLIHRYERMLTRQLHRRIRERSGLPGQNRQNIGRNL